MIKKITALSLSLSCINVLAMDSQQKDKEVIKKAAYCILKNEFGKQIGSRILPRKGTATYYRSHGREICTKSIDKFHFYKTDDTVKPTAYFFKQFDLAKLSITIFYDKYSYQLCSYTSAQNQKMTLADMADACRVHLTEHMTEAKEKKLLSTYLHEGAYITYQS